MARTHYLVTYDISETPIREKVGNLCKDYSLERIQYSVFFGRLSPDEVKSLYLECKTVIKSSSSNIHFIKICSACERNHQVLLSVSLEDKNKKIADNSNQRKNTSQSSNGSGGNEIGDEEQYELKTDIEIEKWEEGEVIIF